MPVNDTIEMEEGEDFFQEMYSDSVFKTITIGAFFFSSFLGGILEVGIIWYEKNGDHNYRTALNQLFSTISWIAISYILLVYVPEGTRYVIGPLPETFCDFHHWMKNFLTCCFILAFDGIICLRYIFIFKWGQFSVFDDNLIVSFLQLSIVVLSFWIALVKWMSPGRRALNYFMCAGKNPNEKNEAGTNNSITRQYDTTGILSLLSFVLHLVLSMKIFLYQRRMEKRTENVELGRMSGPCSGENGRKRNVAWGGNEDNSGTRSSTLPKSMADLTTQMLCLTFLVVVSIVTTVMNGTDPDELNQYGNRWLAYFNQIIAFSFAISAICFQYYAKNAALRNAIWRNMRALCQSTSDVR